MRIRSSLGMAVAVCLVGGSLVAGPAAGAGSSGGGGDAASIVAGMTMDEKIGQLLQPDFRDWQQEGEAAPTGLTEMNDEVAGIVEDYHLGGVILFAENVVETEQTLLLTRAYQETSPDVPLLITIDQEGGIVTRLQSGTMHAGNMALGATRSEKSARQTGKVLGQELKALGINTNFAPVLDVNVNPDNPVIGVRSFSSDPQLVSDLGIALIEGTTKAGTTATAKHFPGHGDTAVDSHYGLPRVDKTLEELEEVELYPFQQAIDAGSLDMIMTAHIQYPELDDTTAVSIEDGSEVILPATLSSKILTDLLRGDMGFEGVVVTDAMNMEGVAQHFGQKEASVLTLIAGADIALMPVTMRSLADVAELEALIDMIYEAINAGDLTEEAIDEKVERIISVKIDQGLFGKQPSLKKQLRTAERIVGSKTNLRIQARVAEAAVTLVRNEDDTLPYEPSRHAEVLLLAPFDYQADAMEHTVLSLIDDKTIPSVQVTAVDYEEEQVIGPDVEALIDDADYVIAGSYVVRNDPAQEGGEIGDPEDPEDWPITYPRSAMLHAQDQGIPFLAMSLRNPYDVANFPEADAAMAVYGFKALPAPNIPAGIRAAFGAVNPSGLLPVDVPDVVNEGETLYPFGYGLSY